VVAFTSSEKGVLPPRHEACIVISTYSMICHEGKRSQSGEIMIDAISQREWGLMILDEVHVAPADMFQTVVRKIHAHCKLGLTATLVREDNKIEDLAFIVGPKLYEANWIDLTLQGYLAKVDCLEVWCPMTKEFYREYISHSVGTQSRLQRLLYTLNPCKFRVCEYLLKYHIQRGDKVIIFSDDVPALIMYCVALSSVVPMGAVPYIYGGTTDKERSAILNAFKSDIRVSCLGLSKVGDTALDIPEANVIIQVSSHFGARRQEAQRLGRILRPKPNPTGGFNAFFYTLISTDTKEMYFSSKRQQYLIDQGYTFRVVQDLAEKANQESAILNDKKKEIDLLQKVLAYTDVDQKDEEEDIAISRVMRGEMDEEMTERVVVKHNVTASTLSGGRGATYMEF
jgi:DNA excision repair protein ERCC-3